MSAERIGSHKMNSAPPDQQSGNGRCGIEVNPLRGEEQQRSRKFLKLLRTMKLLRVYEEKERKTKMKRLKKLLAFVIACTMIFGTMSMMSFAEPTNPGDEMNNLSYDAEIVIYDLMAKDTVKLYKVLEWDGSTNFGTDSAYGGWKFVSPFTGSALGFATDAKAIEAIIGDPAGNPPVKFGLNSKIAGDLARAAGNPVDTQTIDSTTYTYTITSTDNKKLGLYMALITPADQNTVYNPVFISADFNTTNPSSSWTVTSDATYSNSSAAKKSTVSTNKEAEGGDDEHNSYDDTWLSVRPGETVDFTVTVVIPGYGSVYKEPHFVVNDKLTDMVLTTVPSVSADGLSDSDFDITYENDGTTLKEDTAEYHITFHDDYLMKVAVPTTVTITYTAEISTDAPQNVNVEKNEVWIEYSHDPTNETDFDVKKDGTNHYTFTIDADTLGGYGSEIHKSGAEIVKVGVDAHGNPINDTKYWSDVTKENGWQGPLEGATFTLYEADDSWTKGAKYEGVDGTVYENIASDEFGRLTISGLDAGKYILVEDKAPNGYIKTTEELKIEIIPHFSEELEEVTEYYKGGNWSFDEPAAPYKTATYYLQLLDSYDVMFNGEKAATYTFDHEGTTDIKVSDEGTVEIPSSIVNTKGVELPATGGMGTTIFYVIGAVLVLGAGILLVTRRRMDIG